MVLDEDKSLAVRLGRVYGKMLGELARIDNPPKRLTRLIADRERYEAGAGERALRRQAILDVLPSLIQVAKFLDPSWSEEDVKPIYPNQGRRPSPPGGWAGAAFEVLRAAKEPMSIADIGDKIAHRYDYDMSDSELRQLTRNAIASSLKVHVADLVRHPGDPVRWSLPPEW